jgi:CheY-like chemotaxis protein
MNILVVDDEPDIVGELSYILKDFGHTVFEASHGVEALRIIATHDIDRVLTDFDMPFLDGLSLLRQIKKEWPSIQVIVMSGDNQLGEDYWKKLGASGFLAKPFKISMILKALTMIESPESSSPD